MLRNNTRRGIGFTQKRRNSNVGLVHQKMFKPLKVQQPLFDRRHQGDQSGDGFIDIIHGIVNKGKKFVDLATGETATNLRNMLPDSDQNARPGFAGEQHGILKLPNGKFGVANYLGPKTNLEARLLRGDKGRTPVDTTAQAHDIRYLKAKNTDDTRKADQIMLKKVNQIKKNRADAPMNISQGRLIASKIKLEDLGLMKKNAFTGDFKGEMSDEVRKISDVKLKELEQQGFGSDEIFPVDALKLKVLKKLARSSNKSHSKSKKKNQMGQGKIQDFVVKKIIPSLFDVLKIPKNIIPEKSISNIIRKSLNLIKKSKQNNLKSIISQLAKTILPIITHAKIKSLNKSGAGMCGSGITVILGKHEKTLLKNLTTGLEGAFKKFIKVEASGNGMCGSGFFGDLWNGVKSTFNKVIKPILKVAAPILSVVAPEIGVPLSILSSLT